MRRLWSITFISLAVVAGAAAYVVAGPVARMSAESAALARGLDRAAFIASLQKQARQRPRDARAWLAFAIASSIGEEGETSVNAKAFRRVFQLKPKWPAPRLILGALLVREAPLNRSAEYASLYPERAKERKAEAEPLTAAQRGAIMEARTVLEQARGLAPDDAAPDYLLAYLALAQRRDSEAEAALRAGMGKNGWEVGQREAAVAQYEAYLRALPAFKEMLISPPLAGTSLAGLSEMARVLAGMAVQAEQRGDAERAIFIREAVMHLGRLTMAHGYELHDASSGTSIWTIATREPLTPREERRATAGLTKPKPDETGPLRQRWNDALRRASQAKLASYLRAHGRPELADDIIPTERKLTDWRRQWRAALEREVARGRAFLAALNGFVDALIAAGAALMLLSVCGFAYLALVAAKRRPQPIAWARWKWTLVVLGCFLIPILISVILHRHREWEWWGPPMVGRSTPIFWGVTAAVVSLPLLVVVTLLVTWLVRRRRPLPENEQRPGFGRQYVGTLAAVLLPVTALLVVAAIGFWVPFAARSDALSKREKVRIYQGELAYYGLPRPLSGR